MISQVVLDEMARANESVRERIQDASARIMLLAEAYRILGKKFTFDSDRILDDKVNSVLVELSDAVLDDMVTATRKGLETDDDTSIAWARLSTNAQNTVDKYSSHLKFILEGWIAIGFANKLSSGRIVTMLMSYMENPYTHPLWRAAFEDGLEYAAGIIRDKGYRWGRGTPISPLKGMILAEESFINTAYQRGVVKSFSAQGAIGYRVFRGSGFDCAFCDELCVGIHPITEVVLPAHPRCRCYAVPVFAGEV